MSHDRKARAKALCTDSAVQSHVWCDHRDDSVRACLRSSLEGSRDGRPPRPVPRRCRRPHYTTIGDSTAIRALESHGAILTAWYVVILGLIAQHSGLIGARWSDRQRPAASGLRLALRLRQAWPDRHRDVRQDGDPAVGDRPRPRGPYRRRRARPSRQLMEGKATIGGLTWGAPHLATQVVLLVSSRRAQGRLLPRRRL